MESNRNQTMDCKCAQTLNGIIKKANKIRRRNGMKEFTYQQARIVWLRIHDAHDGKRNPYAPHNKIGPTYVFTSFAANKIIKKMAEAQYRFIPRNPWKHYEWVAKAA